MTLTLIMTLTLTLTLAFSRWLLALRLGDLGTWRLKKNFCL